MQSLPLVTSKNLSAVANFTITAIISRPQHFIVTPSVRIYNLLKNTINSFRRARTSQPELVQLAGSGSQNELDRILEESQPIIYVEAHALVPAQVIEAERDLALHGDTIHQDARKKRTCISLDNPAFIASVDAQLKEHYSKIDTTKVLEALAIALYPAPTPVNFKSVDLPQETRVRLHALKVLHEGTTYRSTKYI